MSIICFLVMYSFISTIGHAEESGLTVILEDNKGWSISSRQSNESSFRFYFNCNDCSLLRDWAGLKFLVEFFPDSTSIRNSKSIKREGVFTQKGKTNISMYGNYKLIDNKNLFTSNNNFKFILYVTFSKYFLDPTKVIEGFFVNDEFIYGRSNYKVEKPCCGKFSEITEARRDCRLFTKIIDYEEPAYLATISLNIFSLVEIRSVIFTLIVQDVLPEIRSSDFRVVRDDDNQWTFTDFGYILGSNKTFQTKLTLEANHHIRNPVPLSIILNDNILCGYYPRSSFAPYLTNGTEKISSEMDLRPFYQINVMLYILITFNILFGIYAIVTTYQMIDWRRHYDDMILSIWNKLHGQSFLPDKFITEYANADV